ncbi:pentapeptide repeat-containing protein [Filibacter tadaridae]|uniref:Pentapeptide repeats (8 copies) n=1 Tax=Filibacter tadaridae TaxID=2483811 RepID=A0A3P5WQQ9_9BACL|nr:pentapeptide repeat-containing protein [Filibacter tadaridae]VDC20956.1 Pentapeptide repeats (8 copies) [Filibacter tadaridae]
MVKKATDKRQKPKLSAEHELMRIDDIWKSEGYVERVRFEAGLLVGEEGGRLSFDDCLFKDVSFAGSDLKSAEFVDVRFDTCDFSNANLQNATFHRCEIVNSKLTGTDFANSSMGHTLVSECDGRYMNFSFSRMKEVEFSTCNLTDSEFYECTFKGVRFKLCKMDNINFMETELNGVDLSESTYDRIEVTLPKIAGCIVSTDQAIGFARVLGLSVKEE